MLFYRILLIVSLVMFSWLVMQGVHELGHVSAALAAGAKIEHVELCPLSISRTDVSNNQCPLTEVWAGPIVGILLPFAAFLLATAIRCPMLYLFRFFAGFCLVANGVYIGAGWLLGAGGASDPAIMLANHSPLWTLILFGVFSFSTGLFLWHKQGVHFGFGDANGQVDEKASWIVFILLLVTVVSEFLV